MDDGTEHKAVQNSSVTPYLMSKHYSETAACTGGRRLSGLADDGPEDLTADDGAEHKAPPTLVPDSEDGLINTTKAGLAKLASASDHNMSDFIEVCCPSTACALILSPMRSCCTAASCGRHACRP